ncbi:MAG: ZIP family metal transporter [Bacteroidales bacterium]|jgi:zinc transporter ZupT|nr:ZIP family metal transporter [Bacteroidales bacterium]
MLFLWLAILFLSAIISGGLFFVFNAGGKTLKYISIFGGAFLLAVCLVDMLPRIFTQNGNPTLCAAFILGGFLVQLLLELVSHGAEHGHIHNETSHNLSFIIPLTILIGISIHAFFEGFALIEGDNINTSLFTGVILHNIPVSIVIVSSFIQNGSSKTKSFFMLSIFAVMGVVGAMMGHYSDLIMRYSAFVQAFVVGILLHVAVSTLFDSEESHHYNLVRFLIVVAAFALVLLLPYP